MIEYELGETKTIFRKDYDGESYIDMSDIPYDESIFDEIPVDKNGFMKGTFRVTIEWFGEE